MLLCCGALYSVARLALFRVGSSPSKICLGPSYHLALKSYILFFRKPVLFGDGETGNRL